MANSNVGKICVLVRLQTRNKILANETRRTGNCNRWQHPRFSLQPFQKVAIQEGPSLPSLGHVGFKSTLKQRITS
jgi:hypothetical protein